MPNSQPQMTVEGAWMESMVRVVSLESSLEEVEESMVEAGISCPMKSRIQGRLPVLSQSWGVYFSIAFLVKDGSSRRGREIKGLV